MKNLFVPYELAVKLKEKGFDEPCFGHWNYNNDEINYWYDEEIQNERTNKYFLNSEEQFPKMNKNGCTAPLYQQVIDWFRDKHEIFVIVQRDWDKGGLYNLKYIVELENQQTYCEICRTGDYCETLTKAIEESLKLIPQV